MVYITLILISCYIAMTMEDLNIYCENCGHCLVLKQIDGVYRPICEKCGHIRYYDPKVVVVVVLEKDEKILMVKRAIPPFIGLWSIPGGYVDRGEIVENAGIREISEETTLDVDIDRLIGVFSETDHPVIVIAYAGAIKAGNPLHGPEVSAVEFFSISDLPDLAFDRDKLILEAWKNGVGTDQNKE